MQAAYKMNMRFGAGADFKIHHTAINPPQFTMDPVDYYWSINNRTTAIACLHATQACFYAGMGEYDPSLRFTRPPDRLIPGDWVYLDNRTANTTPGLEGENLIYMGKGEYWGHLSGTRTIRPLGYWKSQMQSWEGGTGLPVLNPSIAYPGTGLEP